MMDYLNDLLFYLLLPLLVIIFVFGKDEILQED